MEFGFNTNQRLVMLTECKGLNFPFSLFILWDEQVSLQLQGNFKHCVWIGRGLGPVH